MACSLSQRVTRGQRGDFGSMCCSNLGDLYDLGEMAGLFDFSRNREGLRTVCVKRIMYSE